MSFHVADAITGRNLRQGAAVVGFLVQSQHDKFPLDETPNRAATRPSYYFALESLPIFGIAADCGMMEVLDESQLGVRLALLMTGESDWEALSDNGFGRGHSVRYMGRPEPAEGKGRTNARNYGLCLIHLETYLHLVGRARTELASKFCYDGFDSKQLAPAKRAENVRSTIDILETCRRSPYNLHLPTAPPESDFSAHFDLMKVCSLRAERRELEMACGEMPRFTGLVSAFANVTESDFGADFTALTRELPGLKPEEILSREGASLHESADLEEYLSLLWDCLHLGSRMYDIHALFKPSPYSGNDWSGPSLLDLVSGTLPGMWAEMVGLEVGHNDSEVAEGILDAEITRLEATTAKMREILSTARAAREQQRS
jgi:hypothetical protein